MTVSTRQAVDLKRKGNSCAMGGARRSARAGCAGGAGEADARQDRDNAACGFAAPRVGRLIRLRGRNWRADLLVRVPRVGGHVQ